MVESKPNTNWLTHRLKGLTLAEVLVTLALTSIVVTLAYTGLNYVQKLYVHYQQQTRFIQSYSQLKKRLHYESLHARYIVETSPSEFSIYRDSAEVKLKLLPKSVVTIFNTKADTFYLEPKRIEKNYQAVKNPLYAGRLIRTLQFDCQFTKQVFTISFYKPYDAATLLELEDVALLKLTSGGAN